MMKQKWLFGILLFIISNNVFAIRTYSVVGKDAYFGVDVQYTSAIKNDKWKPLFRETHPGSNLFIGYRANQYLSFELGYSWTNRRAKDLEVAAGDTFLGVTNTLATTARTASQIRLKNTHFDAHVSYPIFYGIDIFAKVGVGFARNTIKIRTDQAGDIQTKFDSIYGKTEVSPRIGIGLYRLFGENLGLRVLYHYDHLRKTELRNVSTETKQIAGHRPFKKGGNTISLGIYYVFNAY